VTKPVNSLADDFKAQGYKTIGLHPFWQNSWRRDAVYPLLGFDEAIFADNFDKPVKKGSSLSGKPKFGDYEYIRGYLSDSECYKKIERTFEDKDEDEKLFLFNVTIQNHGGYDYNKDDFTADISALSDVTDTDKKSARLNQYLTLAHNSDKALGELIDYFKSYDEPTVIVFFGDHQPNLSFTRNINEDFTALTDNLSKDSKYVVPYFVWANYDIEQKDVPLSSPAYLSLIMKQVCNMPLTKLDVMREELMQSYPVLNARCAVDSDGNRVNVSDIDDELYNNYKIIEYGMTYDGVTP
jgi:phosphoglycerol transferase MdoB-like AlkP superfamily enzyme